MANEDPEQEALNLPEMLAMDSLESEAQDEQAAIRRLEDRVAKFMTQAAMQEFPSLKNMSSSQIREFGNTVTHTASDFALQASHLAYEAEKEN
jgi:hypothetical protein